jgi:phosphate-selective porin OprO/OprP
MAIARLIRIPRRFLTLSLSTILVYPGLLQAQIEQDTDTADLPEENREEISQSVSENTQTALSLKRLLLGRKYTFFGRIEGDVAFYGDEVFDGEDGAEIRRFRVGVAGVLTDRLSYKVELDLTDKTATVSDVYLKLDTPRIGSLTLGNQRVTQNLSAMTGTLSQLFLERPLPVTTFSLARRLGISHDFHGNKWSVHGMLFGADPNNDAGDRGWAVRGVVNPTRKDGGVAHLGFSVVREKMDREARYRTRPESHVTDIRLVDTGELDDVDYQNIFGLEVAGARGSLTGRIEAFKTVWERLDGSKDDFRGAYLEVGYFPTGQGFNYQQGRFVRPRFDVGTRAVELGFRASWVDLNDTSVQGGEQLNIGLAVNLYLRHNLRIQSNLLHVRTDEVAGDVRSWIAQARVQFNW